MNIEQHIAQVDFTRNVYSLLGLPFDAVTLDDAVRQVHLSVIDRTPCFISTPNINFLISCLADNEFRNSVINSDLSIADGMPIVWISRLLGIPIVERVAGSELFERLRLDSNRRIKVYFFGGLDGVAEKACAILNAESSGVVGVGFDAPGFGSLEEMSSDATIAKINASGADFLVVALGAKKGQAWIVRNRERINVPIISHLGAVVNFVAGNIQRAPVLMQKIGLEWLWRIYQEPQLWMRYFNDGLCLGNLVLFKIVPYTAWMHLNKKRFSDVDALKIAINTETEGSITLKLSGACTDKTIGSFKNSLGALALVNTTFTLDLEQVSIIDAAFIGLCMLLYKHTVLRGGKLLLLNINDLNKKIIKWNCAEFLL